MKEILSGKTLKSKLIQGGGGNLIIRIFYTLFSFGIGVLLARLMGASLYGNYSYIYAIIMILAIPAQFGIPILVVRETAQSYAKKEWGMIRGLWQWSTRITVLLTIIITSGTFIFLQICGDRINQAYLAPLFWGLALMPLLALSNLRGAALRGLQKVIRGQLPEQILAPGFFIILVLGAAFVFAQKISPAIAMMFQSIATLLAFLIGAILLIIATPRESREASPIFKSKVWLSSSFSLALISGMQTVNKWVSIIILGFFVPSTQIGIYRVAVQMALLTDFGLQVVNPVIAPQIAHMFTLGDKKRLQILAIASARVVLFFNLIITFAFLFFGRQFLTLFFGQEFIYSYPPLLIMLSGQLINSITGSVGYFLNMTGFEKETLKARGISLGLNIILSIIFISSWGIIGAAIATSLTLIVWNILLWWKVRKHLGIISLAFNIKSVK